jgi:hypothetical protein
MKPEDLKIEELYLELSDYASPSNDHNLQTLVEKRKDIKIVIQGTHWSLLINNQVDLLRAKWKEFKANQCSPQEAELLQKFFCTDEEIPYHNSPLLECKSMEMLDFLTQEVGIPINQRLSKYKAYDPKFYLNRYWTPPQFYGGEGTTTFAERYANLSCYNFKPKDLIDRGVKFNSPKAIQNLLEHKCYKTGKFFYLF